jgi:hypothetical protein
MKKTILEYIIDGSITVGSIEAFGSVVEEFPGRPEIRKMFAELLAACKRTDDAVQQYDEAAYLFLDAGRLFPAWVCKLLQWQLQRPSRHKFLEFHQALGNTPHNGAPVDEFIRNLTPPERMAVFSKFGRIRVPAKKTIMSNGDRRACLYLVVCGALQEASYGKPSQTRELQREDSRILWEADCFGDAYPFSRQSSDPCCVHTTRRVELVTISRQQLIDACSRFPGVERGLMRLCRFQVETNKKSARQDFRPEKHYRIAASARAEATAGG